MGTLSKRKPLVDDSRKSRQTCLLSFFKAPNNKSSIGNSNSNSNSNCNSQKQKEEASKVAGGTKRRKTSSSSLSSSPVNHKTPAITTNAVSPEPTFGTPTTTTTTTTTTTHRDSNDTTTTPTTTTLQDAVSVSVSVSESPIQIQDKGTGNNDNTIVSSCNDSVAIPTSTTLAHTKAIMEDAKKHDSDHFREEKHPETNASTTSNHPEMENRQTKTSSSSSSSPRAVVYDISQRTVVVRTEENNHKTTPSEIIDDQRNNNNDNDRTRGLSDYELLRLRNIQRNNARLAALGLLDHPIESSLSAKTKTTSKRARKRPATTIPTRRSSRNRRSVSSLVEQESSLMDTSLGVVDSSSRRPSMQVEPSEEVEEKEEFTVSPLLQYNMNNHPQSCHQEEVAEAKHNADSVPAEITSLSPVGPRLQPPKGLGAIYSLQFFPSFSGANDHKKSWLVGAGKAGIVALWDCNNNNNNTATTVKENKDHGMIDPILSWKAHNGRWIADAKFVPGPASCTNNNADPSRLLTAANDGKLCLWDLTTVSVHSGVPKQLFQTGKELHTSGIFAMDVHNVQEGNSTDSTVCTGSKDKTVAVSSLESIARGSEPMWRSEYHTGKVGAVQLRGGCRGSTLLASASDDGYVAIHDYRTNDIVAELANTHERPHSVVWDPQSSQDVFMTAGLDKVIKLWDLRNTSQPILSFHGHVPNNTHRCKKIHHPVFYRSRDDASKAQTPFNFILTGGQGSHSLSIFKHHENLEGMNENGEIASCNFYSRGKLPEDCGDAGCIAVQNSHHGTVAISVDDGEVLMLAPKYRKF